MRIPLLNTWELYDGVMEEKSVWKIATIGIVAAFDKKTQSWEEYSEISKTYSLIWNLLSPDPPKSKSYDQLMDLLKNHFNPKPRKIVQCFKFDSCSRRPDETITDFVAELCKQDFNCDILQQMLRDRQVSGVDESKKD